MEHKKKLRRSEDNASVRAVFYISLNENNSFCPLQEDNPNNKITRICWRISLES